MTRQRRPQPRQSRPVKSRCGDEFRTARTAEDMARMYDIAAAETMDTMQAIIYSQHAEHYRRGGE